MTITVEQQAPGCFGAASVYSMDSKVCAQCVASASCGEAAMKNLQAIREQVDVRDLLAKHKAAQERARNARVAPRAVTMLTPSPLPPTQPKSVDKPVERTTTMARVTFDLSPDDQHVIALIGQKSTKARDQAIVLCKTNKLNDMRDLLPQGRNPFAESGPAFFRIACNLLINGGFTKASLKQALMGELNWTDGTAASHVAISCALMVAFKIVTLDMMGAFVLNPALGRDNTVLNNQERKAA